MECNPAEESNNINNNSNMEAIDEKENLEIIDNNNETTETEELAMTDVENSNEKGETKTDDSGEGDAEERGEDEILKTEMLASKDVADEDSHEQEKGMVSEEIVEKTDEEFNESEEVPTEQISIRLDKHVKQHKDCILEPLNFPETNGGTTKGQNIEAQKAPILITNSSFESEFDPNETPCMLCDDVYNDVEMKEEHDEYLCHLVVEHKLVVADVKLVADLRSYAIYWKKRFSENPLQEFCAVIKTNSSPKDMHESEKYFLLCDALPEDRKVREKLQLEKLKQLVEKQTEERNNDNSDRMCLFCTKFFIGSRSELFNHMNEDHNFNVGHPHNLIHIEEFLNVIEKKLSNLECLYCEKLFRDRILLREHMRKKSHRRLNPKNKTYDKYYIINYLEFGKNWEILQGEPDQLDNPEDWEGWNEDVQSAVCFFCTDSFSSRDQVYDHMKTAHDFDFMFLRKDMNLSFYQQVKMINFIRREVHQSKEADRLDDDHDFKRQAEEKDEMAKADEMAGKIKDSILTSTRWNQPQYYFPTYENDTLLCQLDDKEGLFEPEDTFIIGEDGIDCKAIINESVLTDLVVNGYFD